METYNKLECHGRRVRLVQRKTPNSLSLGAALTTTARSTHAARCCRARGAVTRAGCAGCDVWHLED